jgi:anti-sigma factor RsiW
MSFLKSAEARMERWLAQRRANREQKERIRQMSPEEFGRSLLEGIARTHPDQAKEAREIKEWMYPEKQPDPGPVSQGQTDQAAGAPVDSRS